MSQTTRREIGLESTRMAAISHRGARRNRRKPSAISLFAGAGGLDIGVDAAGFKTICAVELDPHCVSTLQRNARGKAVWQVDVRALDPKGVATSLNLKPGELGLLHGGPPCQPFSQIGKKTGIKDPRGQLAFQMVRFAKEAQPAAVLIEQVPKFLDAPAAQDMTMLDALSEEFEHIGYDLQATVLDAADCGVPQKRKRAIIVAVPKARPSISLWLAKGSRPPLVRQSVICPMPFLRIVSRWCPITLTSRRPGTVTGFHSWQRASGCRRRKAHRRMWFNGSRQRTQPSSAGCTETCPR